VAFTLEYLDQHLEAIPLLAQWHQHEWGAVTPDLSLADRIRGFHARARRGGVPTGVVAVVDSSVVGLACLVAADIESHAHLTPWLASVLVAPQFRGRGIGSALAERVAAEATALSVLELFLFTFDKQALYSRLGWSHLEPAVYAGRPGTVMIRRLAP
jgi:N-acetylglutamate synthase-like GNAT family acetyltransferase